MSTRSHLKSASTNAGCCPAFIIPNRNTIWWKEKKKEKGNFNLNKKTRLFSRSLPCNLSVVLYHIYLILGDTLWHWSYNGDYPSPGWAHKYFPLPAVTSQADYQIHIILLSNTCMEKIANSEELNLLYMQQHSWNRDEKCHDRLF